MSVEKLGTFEKKTICDIQFLVERGIFGWGSEFQHILRTNNCLNFFLKEDFLLGGGGPTVACQAPILGSEPNYMKEDSRIGGVTCKIAGL